jgi:1,4-dihydroxy-2-naphthoyl-CoA hydrolase
MTEAAMKEWNVGLMSYLGMRFVEVGPDRVVAELDVRAELATIGGAVHGGTLMALADTAGAAGTASMGLRTATLESKTNFFAAATAGKLRAEATALHKGRRTHVWQTRVTDDGGRLLALTIQTQMIL